jgi:hypothetical protein
VFHSEILIERRESRYKAKGSIKSGQEGPCLDCIHENVRRMARRYVMVFHCSKVHTLPLLLIASTFFRTLYPLVTIKSSAYAIKRQIVYLQL